MQRLSSWFEEHLPLNRRAKSRASNGASRVVPKKILAKHEVDQGLGNAKKCAQNSSNNSKKKYSNPFKPHINKTFYEPNTYWSSSVYSPPTKYFSPPVLNQTQNCGVQSLTGRIGTAFGTAQYQNRQRIRTNPWIRHNNQRNPESLLSPTTSFTRSCHQNQRCFEDAPERLLSSSAIFTSTSMHHHHFGLIEKLEGLENSICSSGYGTGEQTTSADCSPESSVHSPNWQQLCKKFEENHHHNLAISSTQNSDVQRRNTGFVKRQQFPQSFNNENDKEHSHIYHELESLNRLSLLLEDESSSSFNSELDRLSSCSSISEYYEHHTFVNSPSMAFWRANKPEYENSTQSPHVKPNAIRAPSPIYAVPYADPKSNIGSGGFKMRENSAKRSRKDDGRRYGIILSPRCFRINSPSNAKASNPQRKKQLLVERRRNWEFLRRPSVESSSSGSSGNSTISCDSWTPVMRHPSHRLAHSPLQSQQWESKRRNSNNYSKNPYSSQCHDEVMAQLDQQITELQLQSHAVRKLVEHAKERQDKTRIQCREHLSELRKMRGWFYEPRI